MLVYFKMYVFFKISIGLRVFNFSLGPKVTVLNFLFEGTGIKKFSWDTLISSPLLFSTSQIWGRESSFSWKVTRWGWTPRAVEGHEDQKLMEAALGSLWVTWTDQKVSSEGLAGSSGSNRKRGWEAVNVGWITKPGARRAETEEVKGFKNPLQRLEETRSSRRGLCSKILNI